jgi:TrmH family RNA methyltransferase
MALYNVRLLTNAQCARIDVVLVSPRNPLNIGAAARAMVNFGFAQLSVVAPFEAHWREAKSAVGAPELLASAREFPSLAEAVAECTYVMGTGTLTHRKAQQPVILLPDLAPTLDSALDSGGRVALVFGPEKHGLTRDDLAFCHALVTIPTEPTQPSMNLGQAVAVCLYELTRAHAERLDERSDRTKLSNTPESPTSGALDRMADLIEQTMERSGYSPRIMEAANRHDLRLLLRRLQWSEADARRALGLFRRVLWRIQRSGRKRQ